MKFAVSFRAEKSDPVGVNNPQFNGMGILTGYPPFGTSVGDLVTGSISIQGSGTFTRAVT